MKSFVLSGACAAFALSAATVASAQTSAPPAAPEAPAAVTAAAPTPGADVIEAMRAQGQFTVLLKALDAANLTERLKASPGVTVFAPTDAAFAALPAGTLDKLLDPQHADDLRKVLLHHTVDGKVAPAELIKHKGMVKTGADAEMALDGADGRVTADEATVTGQLPAGNGAVYAIDKVIAPEGVDLGAGAN